MSCFRYIVAHCFARPLMYPGSVGLLQNAMSKSDCNNVDLLFKRSRILNEFLFVGQALNDGRSNLIAKVIIL